MPDDDVLAENIRLRQELELLRSLLAEIVVPLSDPEIPEKVAEGLDFSREKEVQHSTTLSEKDIDQKHKIEIELALEAGTYPYSVSSCDDAHKKQPFAWSWQDEGGIWREYDPDICEVLHNDRLSGQSFFVRYHSDIMERVELMSV